MRSVGQARRATRRARPARTAPSWTLLSMALSPENRVQVERPDVDAAVQLAAEIALSARRKFRYNPSD
jgi:hypothetical protein